MTPGLVTQTPKLVTLLSIPEEKEGTEAVKTLAKGDVSINLHKALFIACVFGFFFIALLFC